MSQTANDPTIVPTSTPSLNEVTQQKGAGVTYKSDSQYETFSTNFRLKNNANTYEFFIADPVYKSNGYDGTCPFGVIQKSTNKEIAMFPINGVACTVGTIGYYPEEGFLWGWLNDDEFIIQHTHGELIAYHINGSNRRVLSYDATKYVVVKGIESAWLARPRDVDVYDSLTAEYNNAQIFILDTEGALEVTHDFGEGLIRDLTYDSENNGFFIIREFDDPAPEEEAMYYTLRTYTTHWIDAVTLTVTDIATIGPALHGGGRGCEAGKFSSTPGTVTYTGLDCFVLPEGIGANDILTFTLP